MAVRRQESHPLPGSLNTIQEEKREKRGVHFPSLSSETGICQLGVVDPLWVVAEFPSWEDYKKQANCTPTYTQPCMYFMESPNGIKKLCFFYFDRC